MAFLVAAAVGALLGCWGGGDQFHPAEDATSRDHEAANLVLIVVDTLRADHTSVYGYSRDTTPRLRQLADESVVFDNAFASASCTFPSVNSLLTSRPPFDFVDDDPISMAIPDDTPTLASILSSSGFQTVAVSASPIVSATPTDLNPNGGFGRGFEVFDERCQWRRGACVNERIRRHLQARDDRRLFLYVHLMDPHGPYTPVPEHLRTFAKPLPESVEPHVARGIIATTSAAWYQDESVAPDPAELAHFIDLYDDEVLMADYQIGRLIDQLEIEGLSDDTLLVIAADHGEEFFEHGDLEHCRNLFDTQLKTPLIMRLPSRPGAVRIDAAVSNLDIMPTVLELLGVDAAAAAEPEMQELEMQGESLAAVFEGEVLDANRVVFAWQNSWTASVSSEAKLMARPRSRPQFYVRDQDPGELSDLLALPGPPPPPHDNLRRELRSWIAENRPVDDERLIRHLEALGYLQ